MTQRIAVVTGGTRGIERAIAEDLHHAGYTVIATFLGNETAAKAFHNQTGISTIRWDVSDFQACQDHVESLTQAHGPIDILVNNAGITRDAFLHKMTPQMWAEVVATNLTSCFNMSRGIVPGMRDRKFGRIINISSINALKGQVGQTNYAAAKAGIIGFTKALALETASCGITVNAIAPGYIDTEMVQAVSAEVLEKIIAQIPARRLGTPKEIARAVLFLANDDASYITGATLSLNGGQYLS